MRSSKTPRSSTIFVICGTFNAQIPSEYDIFVQEGFRIGNCSKRFGTVATLRDIPSDNIIVSPSLEIEKFKVLTGYQLGVEHYPVRATIRKTDSFRIILARH